MQQSTNIDATAACTYSGEHLLAWMCPLAGKAESNMPARRCLERHLIHVCSLRCTGSAVMAYTAATASPALTCSMLLACSTNRPESAR
jgi:hypothetical protein